MVERFIGKVALVTGAGKGIGAAAARAFAGDGAAVGVFDFDGEAAESTVKELESAGGRGLAVVGDVRKAADAQRAVDSTIRAFGGLDVLVNNAGVVRYGEAPDFSEEDWDLVVDTNLKGAFLMCKFAIPAIKARGGGAIVNTASVQAFASQQTVAAYSASKGGVVAMTRTLALDHAKDKIRVNCIAPGSVNTAMLRFAANLFEPDQPEEAMRSWGEKHPIGRITEPEEVARLILFLSSDDAPTITGAPYLVDGGLLAGLGI
jgi:NAD(P)-dependent dehydrogenase (short-subunit alcohol dehydrogenase family)